MLVNEFLATDDQPKSKFVTNVGITVFASILITIAAKLSVPFYPVPMTMQTFVIIGLGLALGPKLAVSAVLLYLAQGAIGLPVFSGTPEKGIGIAYMVGPTGGYLLGFILAAAVAGMLAQRGWDKRIVTAFVATVLSSAIIYVPGLLWLGTVIGWDKPVLSFGLYPFLLGDLLKAGLAAMVFPAAWNFLTRESE